MADHRGALEGAVAGDGVAFSGRSVVGAARELSAAFLPPQRGTRPYKFGTLSEADEQVAIRSKAGSRVTLSITYTSVLITAEPAVACTA